MQQIKSTGRLRGLPSEGVQNNANICGEQKLMICSSTHRPSQCFWALVMGEKNIKAEPRHLVLIHRLQITDNIQITCKLSLRLHQGPNSLTRNHERLRVLAQCR